MILPECRWMWQGVESADSLVINSHKWLGAAFDCSLYYVRDPVHLVRVMSTNPSYLQTAADAHVKNYRDWGLPLGRRFRALKLWFLIREQGVAGLQNRLRRDLANAQWLAKTVSERAGWQVLAPVHLQTVCMRHHPPGVDGDALDRHTQDWAARLNRSGVAYVTPAILEGRWMVRVSVGAECTVGHRAVLHGCRVGNRCLVGMGSLLLDNCELADECFLGAGAHKLASFIGLGAQNFPGFTARTRRV